MWTFPAQSIEGSRYPAGDSDTRRQAITEIMIKCRNNKRTHVAKPFAFRTRGRVVGPVKALLVCGGLRSSKPTIHQSNVLKCALGLLKWAGNSLKGPVALWTRVPDSYHFQETAI